jgi:hypothetical protein
LRKFYYKSVDEAWSLLDKISENTDNWDLEEGNKSFFEHEYTCVDNLYSSPLFVELVIRLVLILLF